MIGVIFEEVALNGSKAVWINAIEFRIYKTANYAFDVGRPNSDRPAAHGKQRWNSCSEACLYGLNSPRWPLSHGLHQMEFVDDYSCRHNGRDEAIRPLLRGLAAWPNGWLRSDLPVGCGDIRRDWGSLVISCEL
jgi:hypothetical protein